MKADRSEPSRSASAAPHDSGVLRRIAQGEEGAVRESMDRFGGLVWSLARRMSRNRSDAEDAAQEIFVEVWRCADRFDPDSGSESTFVATIARRRLIDRLRSASRKPETVTLAEGFSSVEPADRAALSDDAAAASEAFQELTDDQQRVLRMAIAMGMTHEQIATALDIPLGSVKTHARRGMIKLRDLMRRRAVAGSDAGAMS